MDKFQRVYRRIIKEDSNDTVGRIGNLTLNKKTNRWDCDGSWVVKPDQIIDGIINIPFGEIKGVFNCMGLDELKSCNNFPTKVYQNLDLANCTNLQNIDGLKNCKILGQLQVGHNGKWNVDDFINATPPHTQVWDYVSMDADLQDPDTGCYWDDWHQMFFDYKHDRWTDDPTGDWDY